MANCKPCNEFMFYLNGETKKVVRFYNQKHIMYDNKCITLNSFDRLIALEYIRECSGLMRITLLFATVLRIAAN